MGQQMREAVCVQPLLRWTVEYTEKRSLGIFMVTARLRNCLPPSQPLC